jgi:hypothetical protein
MADYPPMPATQEEWEVHWAFYKLAVMQRDQAWAEIERLKLQQPAKLPGAF